MLNKLLDRPVTVTMIMLVVIVLGLVSIKLLPVSLIPDVDIPYVTVQVSASDMSAKELDESVVKVLRQQLIQLNSLSDIVSETKDGTGVIKLTFEHGADIDYLVIEVNEKIDRSLSSLPDGVARPKVIKSSATDIPAFYINATVAGTSSEAEFDDLSGFVRNVISKRIEQLPEVAMVDISGYVEKEILIVPDNEKLTQLGLSYSDFESLVTSANVRLGSLSIRDGQYRYNVKFRSYISDKSDVENIWFKSGGRVFQLKDIADVRMEQADRQGLVRSQGKDAVCIAVIKQSDARMADLKKSVNELMEQFRADYSNVDFEVTRDQTQLLEYSINNLIQNIVIGVVLACIIIFLFMMDFKSPALVSLTMPVALIFSMAIFYAVGLTLNIISLAGLLLGVGMMADNTIILVDNITARWQRGEELRDAVLNGTKEVIGPMLSSVLTTCAVFIPLIFVQGIAGSLFYDQAISVTIVLLTSYVVTISVIPVFYWLWYKNQTEFRPVPFLEKFSMNRLFDVVEEKCVNWFLRHNAVAWSILIVSVAGAALCLVAMPKAQLPKITYTEAILDVDWNEQIPLEENSRRVAELESVSEQFVSQSTSMVGVQQFVLGHSGDLGTSQASIYINCDGVDKLEKAKAELTEYISGHYSNADFSYRIAGNIFDMVFSQDEPELLARLRPLSSQEMEADKVRNTLSAVRTALPDVPVPKVAVKTDMLFMADASQMALYGVEYSDLTVALKNAVNQNRIFSIVRGSEVIPIVVGTDKRTLEEVLAHTSIRKDVVEIPVSNLMRQTYTQELKNIVSGSEGNYYPLALDVPSSKVPETMSAVKSAVSETGDFEVSFSGAWFSNKSMVAEMIWIFIIAVLLLYLILASQFESLLQPVLIMSEIVVDIFAALLVLWILGETINLMSLIGLIVVSGIVVNDSILKVDTINKLRQSGYELKHAVMEACSRRMKAIIMTSLTTILAVVPFLNRGNMGDDLQYPMSLVIIAGMVIGTMVSLFVLPALYYSVYKRKDPSK